MVYSHIFNLIASLATIFISLFGVFFLDKYIQHEFLLYFSYLIWAIIVLVSLIRYTWPGANWLYLATYRRTYVSFSQIRELSPLLYAFSGRWFPLKELNQVPKNERIAYLYSVLEASYSKGLIKYPKIRLIRQLMGVKYFETISPDSAGKK